jgi:replicative DNA helicase
MELMFMGEVREVDKIKQKIKEIMKPIEANIIGCLWSNPNLYFDYADLERKLFKNPIWEFYFTIGLKMAKKGINKLDEVATELYVHENEKVKAKYEEFGGYETIQNIVAFATVENIEAYVNELKKWSALYDLVSELNVTEGSLNDFNDLDVNQLYDYFNAKLNHIFINADDGVETHKINENLDQLIEDADKGMNVGMPIPSPILNAEIGGIMDGQIILVGGLSGTGKTTLTIQLMLSAVFENEEPCVIMINEQDYTLWQRELLTWIINNKLLQGKDKKHLFNKRRWREGKFKQEEKELLFRAKEYLENKVQNNQIILVHFKSYSRKQAERVIKKYASLGVKKFVLDTFKISSDRDNNEAFWLSMQEDMRKFDDLIKPSNLNVSLWVTLQLQKGSVLKRYLTGDNIGMAKNVIDVASVALLMRRVRNDEFKDGKNEIKVIDPIEKRMSLSGRQVELDPNKKYIIIFIEKNRNGESQTYQIVAEQDLGHLIYKEVGICDIPFDS